MGCNCKEKIGFPLALSNAKKFEVKTGKTAAIFMVNDVISFTDKKNIRKVKEICCYYTTNGKEHKISGRKKR